MFAMHKKEMFSHNFQDGDDKTPFFIKYSWVWHFTGFPIEQRTEIMKNTWTNTGDKYIPESDEDMYKGKPLSGTWHNG